MLRPSFGPTLARLAQGGNEVTWQLARESAHGVLVLEFEGEISRMDSVKATREVLARLDSGRPDGVLVDARRAVCALGVGDLYAIPAMWEHAAVHRGSALAMAVDGTTAAVRDLEFFENICRNRGWNVRVFGDYDEALAWTAGQIRRGAVGNA
jgi:hypothetical protein